MEVRYKVFNESKQRISPYVVREMLKCSVCHGVASWDTSHACEYCGSAGYVPGEQVFGATTIVECYAWLKLKEGGYL